MPEPHVAPYGSWKSPITSGLIVSATIGLGQIALEGEDTYWIEMRPVEGGRYVVVRRTPGGQTADVTPAGFSVRTRVHEYGGGAFVIGDGTIYFSNDNDQRLYRQTADGRPQTADGSRQSAIGEPQPITPPGDYRYADGVIDRRRNQIICVREDHTAAGHEARNTLVKISLRADGGNVGAKHLETAPNASPLPIVSGHDFYSSPRLSPDGQRLAWLAWNHPNMPWDGTGLWLAELGEDGSVTRSERVAGGPHESIYQPEWSPHGVLHFVSDRTGWWNLYRLRGDFSLQSAVGSRNTAVGNRFAAEPLCEMAAEFGRPQWQFGSSTYAFESASRILCSYTLNGTWRLAALNTETLELQPIELPYTELWGLRAAPGRVVFGAGSPSEPPSIVELALSHKPVSPATDAGAVVSEKTGFSKVLRRSTDVKIDSGYLSIPQAIEFPTEHGLSAHAIYYPPRNQEYRAPAGELPPLLVKSHGGPTAAATTTLDLEIQFWTSRGIGVVDVNYGGSTGYGREYRQRLNGQWGIVDVEDCVNAARYLVECGEADGERLAIRGGSAGGYTTLCALTFRDEFKAGASYYGVSDVEALAKDTHKFESRYLDSMIGPYPERRDLYQARSPIHFVDRLSSPVIFFQGLEDKVVPPDQAEQMVAALRVRGVPVAYLPFEGEQHGFRRAENIQRALDAELYFYSRIFGFELAEPVEPVEIENLKL